MTSFQEIANFLWAIADEVLRDDFKRSKYPDVILPFTVLRRLDCVLAPTKEKVLTRERELRTKGLQNLDSALRRTARHSFYNTSRYDFPKLLDDPKNIGTNLRAYLNGFSDNMREVLDKFKLRSTIDTLQEKELLFPLVQKLSLADLHPDRVDNHAMGTVFEELIRRFNEQSNENPGEHFTPREVIRLMVRLLINGDRKILQQQGAQRTIYDPACGSGGMLSIARDYVLEQVNPNATIRLFGQEVNDETYAVCKSDMLIKGDDEDADNIKPDSCFSRDGHPHSTFEYMLSNPPYGKDWKKEQTLIEEEARRGDAGRFGAGLPRISDGQLLFLQHMLSKRKLPQEGGSRIAIVMNGSPLFTGDAGGGESEIRRWIFENDWLEAIVALPGQLFYNTGINTYIWVLTNRKARDRKGKVVLVNGAATRKEQGKEVEVFARKMRRSLGDKRNELGEEHIAELARLARSFEEGPYSKNFETTDFGYRKITVERPLRLNFQASPERIARLREQPAFQALATSKKKGKAANEETAEGRKKQEQILAVLDSMDSSVLYKDRAAFEQVLHKASDAADLRLAAPVRKVVLAALSEKDPTAEPCLDASGKPEPHPDLRDYENVPLKEDIRAYFEREVLPHIPDAWISEETRDRDKKDGGIGKVGYEINFNRYFYEYESPRSLEEIEADIRRLEAEIVEILHGGRA
jgi:type I restriction enzyme M protein